MKGFISYRFTGEKLEDLKNILTPIQNKLKKVGVDAYCNFFDKDLPIRSKNFKPQDYVFDAFKTLDNIELLFVLITSENKSEGMILEVGYSIAKSIPVVVAVEKSVKNTYLPDMANLVIRFNSTDDLLEKISKTNFGKLNC